MNNDSIINTEEKNKNFFSNNRKNPLDILVEQNEKNINEFLQYKEILLFTVIYNLNNLNFEYFKVIRKHFNYYFHHIAYIVYGAKKALGSYTHFQNLSVSNQIKYIINHDNKTPNKYFYLYNNPIDYDFKLHRNEKFYQNEVLNYCLKYQGIHLALKFVHDTRICYVDPGVYAADTIFEVRDEKTGEIIRDQSTGEILKERIKNGKATHVYFNNFYEWRIFENEEFELEEILSLVLPKLRYSKKEIVVPTIFKDKSKDKYGNAVSMKRGKYKKIKNNLLLPVTQDDIDKIVEINSSLSETIKDYYGLQRIFNLDQTTKKKLGGRCYGLIQQMKKIERKFFSLKTNLCEADYKTNNLNILYYFVTGKKYPGDVYIDVAKKLWGDDNVNLNVYRSIIKPLIISVPGTKKRSDAIKVINMNLIKIGIMRHKKESFKSQYKRLRDWLIDNNFYPNTEIDYKSAYQILEAIEEILYEIKDYFYLDLNSLFQYIESEMAILNVEWLRDHNQFINSIHDGFLIKKEYEKEFKIQMEKNFKKVIDENRDFIFHIITLKRIYQYLEKENKKIKVPFILNKNLEQIKNEIKEINKNKLNKNIYTQRERKERKTQLKTETLPLCPLCVFVNNFQVDYSFSFP